MGTTADKLNKLLETKSNIKTAIEAKGVSVGDIPFSSYAEKVGEISGGGIPSYIVPKNNVNGVYQADNTATTFNLNGATNAGPYALYYAFYKCSNLKTVDLTSLTTLSNLSSFHYAFSGAGIEGPLDLHNLTTITSNGNSCMTRAFEGTKITSVDLSGLQIAPGSNLEACFYNCEELVDADMSSLTIIGGYCLYRCYEGCKKLVNVNLSSLNRVSSSAAMSQCFAKCSALKELRFPAFTSGTFDVLYKDQFNNMCKDCTDIILHFPSNVESVIRGLNGYSDTKPFGAASGQVLFDLPATE